MKRRFVVCTGFGVAAVTIGLWICAQRQSTLPPQGSPSNVPRQGGVGSSPSADASDKGTGKVDASSAAAAKHQRSAEATALAAAAAQSLVTTLAKIDLDKPISYEAAEKWKQSLSDLIGQGSAAIPAIREYLQKNQDINFSIARGGILLGEPSLRAALLDALHQIGGQESTDLMVETLKTSVTPTEVALLAGYLDEQAPGQHQAEVLNAANDAFKLAGEGQLPGWDVAPLFHVIQRLDPAAAATAAQNLISQWKYYSAITLAGLEGGEGINALVQQARDAGGGPDGQNDFALQMIAQVAAQYPQASSALIQQARQGQIPDSAWPKIAMALGGDQYSMINLSPNGQPELPGVSGLKTYHLESGNQNFYSVPLAAIAGPDAVVQRRDIIDQLLALNPGEAAVQALNQARAQLTTLASR